jgi:hypothetical protein
MPPAFLSHAGRTFWGQAAMRSPHILHDICRRLIVAARSAVPLLFLLAINGRLE